MNPITKRNEEYSFGRIYETVSHEYWSDSFFLLKQTILVIGLTVLYAVYHSFS
jgi:hypothetical protein